MYRKRTTATATTTTVAEASNPHNSCVNNEEKESHFCCSTMWLALFYAFCCYFNTYQPFRSANSIRSCYFFLFVSTLHLGYATYYFSSIIRCICISNRTLCSKTLEMETILFIFFQKKKDKEKKIIWYFISETMFRSSLVDACDFKLFVFERINSVCIKCLKYQFTLFLKRFEFVNVTTIDVTNARRAFCVKDITIDILFVFAALCWFLCLSFSLCALLKISFYKQNPYH